MGNYFDKERACGLAARDFNRKTAILEAAYKKAIEKLENDTMFEENAICETAAWFNFKHSPVVRTLIEFNYTDKLSDRSNKYDEKMTITEEIVFGEDAGKVSRMKSIYEKIDAVELTKKAYVDNDVAALIEGAFNLIPLFCLFENDSAEVLKDALEKQKEEEEKENSEKEEPKEEDEEKKNDEKSEEKDDDESEDDSEKKDDDKDEEESDENDTDLIEQYLEEAKKRKVRPVRPPHVVRAAFKLRKKASALAREENVEDAVAANEKAAKLEAEADEINRGK